MDVKQRNLSSLTAEFHDKGKAGRGLTTVNNFLSDNDNEGLKTLLRYHIPDGVYGDELIQRFEVDALIEFYNLLLVASLAGYIPKELNSKLTEEIKSVLGNESVKPYYKKHYPYKLTELTLKCAEAGKFPEASSQSENVNAFFEFISLNRMLKRDEDLERFMGMLDHVTYGNDNIDDLTETLSSYKNLHKSFTKKTKNENDKALWGFIKYTSFLSQLKQILESVSDNPKLQSAMWLFHGYYLDRLNVEMKKDFNTAFTNLEKALSDESLFKTIATEISGGTENVSFSEAELKQFATEAINQAKNDVKVMLDPRWKKSLSNYFES